MTTDLLNNDPSIAPCFTPQQRKKIIEDNMGLVGTVVRRFSRCGEDLEDLFQIGCIGLIKAVEKFDLRFGVKLSTYAVPVIVGEIKRYLRDDGAMHISRSIKTNAMHIGACIEKAEKQTGQTPTVQEIASLLSISPEDVVLAMDVMRPVQYLQAEDTQSGLSLMDTLAAPEAETGLLERLDLRHAVDKLPKRERLLLHLRYDQCKTQSEIAAKLGISQVQVSRLEKRLLLQLRTFLTQL